MQIHTYARRGNIQGVAEELASGIDIDCIDENSQTPLMYAVTSDLANIDMVQFLVENGADLNATESEFQQTVLGLAVQSGNLTKIQFLLDSGANVNYQRPHGYDVLIDAMHGRDITQDRDLLSILNLLLERGAKVDGISSYGETALKVVSRGGRFDAVRLLLKAGSDRTADAERHRQQLEWTPLMFAIVLGSLKDVKNLLDKKANLKARDYWQRTPWLLSIQAGDVDKAKLILASGAGRDERGNCGKTPLMYAIENNRVEVLEWLITEGFDIEATDDFNDTALIVAAEVGATECVDILLQAGANPKIVNDRDKKAISIASNLPIVRMLVKAGEDLGEINEEMRRLLTRMSDKPNGQHERADRRLATTSDASASRASQRELEISLEQYLAGKHRRFGTTNPEIMDIDFWEAMIRCGVSAYSAKSTFDDTDSWDEPVWCYDRFGRTITELPDGRIVEIAGEHEDYYDPDFCIYNDVVVYGDGSFKIFGYPQDIFPPTDFHTATIVGEYIYIIGNLGYINARIDETPVYKLNCQTFKIEKVNTTGEKPGWISSHKASYHKPSNKIYLSGGQVWRKIEQKTEYIDNHLNYALDLINLKWSQINT